MFRIYIWRITNLAIILPPSGVMKAIAALYGPTPAEVCAASWHMYIEYGLNEPKLTLFADEKRWILPPVSIMVMFITYPTMTPFWFCGSGGFHVRMAERGDVGVAVMFIGAPLGAVDKWQKQYHCGQCATYYVHHLLLTCLQCLNCNFHWIRSLCNGNCRESTLISVEWVERWNS